MKAPLPALHAAFAALWLGCVLTEALFERALLSKGIEVRVILAHLQHKLGAVVLMGLLLAQF